MQFPCARCGRTYEIADELCLGRAVKVACPACGNLAVHRVPAPGGASAADAAPALPPPPAPEMASALGDVSDEDFESAWSSVEAPPGPPGAPAPAAPPAAGGPPPPEAPPVSAAASGAGSARGAASAKVSGAGVAAVPRATAPVSVGTRGSPAPARRAQPAPPEEEPVMVTAELVLRRSTRRARLGAAAAAVAVLALLGGGGWLALRFKRDPAAAAARAARPGEVAGTGEAGAAGGLSASDLAKLMGRREPEPAAAAPRGPAAPRAKPAEIRLEDKALLDLLARKGDAAVTVGADEVEALSTSRGTLDEAAIEGTLSRNAGSITACVNRAIAASPDQRLPATRVNLELTIRPSGRVERAAVQEAAIARLPLGQCIAQAAKRMVFPGFDGAAIGLVVPLKLKVGL